MNLKENKNDPVSSFTNSTYKQNSRPDIVKNPFKPLFKFLSSLPQQLSHWDDLCSKDHMKLPLVILVQYCLLQLLPPGESVKARITALRSSILLNRDSHV